MQQNFEKLIKLFGKSIKECRTKSRKKSLNIFAYENDLDPGNLSRIENGRIEPRLTMIWRISEALGVKPSELLSKIETQLGDDFYLIEK